MSGSLSIINTVVCIAAILAAFALSAFLSMFTFATAAFKFAAATGDEKRGGKKDSIDATAKRLLYASDKIASVVYLVKRFALIVSIVALYYIFGRVMKVWGDGNVSDFKMLVLFLPVAFAAMWLQFSALDLVAIRFGKANPEMILQRYSKAFYFVYILMMPLHFLSKALGDKIAREFKIKPKAEFESIDVELMLSAKENDAGAISPYTGKIVRNALRLQELDVSDIMLPRSKVDYFDLDSTDEENLELARRTHHARYPLCRGNLDECYGIVRIKDLFANSTTPENIDFMRLRRETLRVRENEKLEAALVKLSKYRLQMALVEDEFGGVIGVLTLDSAYAELVGQSQADAFEAQAQSIRRVGKNKYKILGSATLHKVEDFLDVDFDTDEMSTFGGLITYKLGRFPEEGEQIIFKAQRLRAVVDKVDERAVAQCTVFIDEKEETE